MKLSQIPFSQYEQETAPNFANKNLSDVVNAALIYIFPLAGIILVIFIILGGYQIMTSGGNPKSMEEGKNKITYSIFGFVIIFLAFWIVQIVARILGLQLIVNVFG